MVSQRERLSWSPDMVTTRADGKKPKDAAPYTIRLKHLPGRHDQQAHGRGWSGGRGRQRNEGGRFSEGGAGATADEPARSYRPAKRFSLDDLDDFLSGDVDFAAGTRVKADGVLAEIMRRQGFDGLPELVDEEELDRSVAAGEREMFRGVRQRTHAESFRDGELFAGVGMIGNGTYVAHTDKEVELQRRLTYYLAGDVLKDLPEGERRSVERWRRREEGKLARQAEELAGSYAGASWDDGTVMRMTLRSNAKVLGVEEATDGSARARAELQRQLDELPADQEDKRRLLENKLTTINDLGRYAALLGYDAVDVSPALPGEFLILNRTALRMSSDFREPL